MKLEISGVEMADALMQVGFVMSRMIAGIGPMRSIAVSVIMNHAD